MEKPIVLVTGGSSGIGRLAVEALAPLAGRVYAASRREVTFEQAHVRWARLDLRDPASIASAVDAVHSECGRIDVVENLRALRDAGYKGWINFETSSPSKDKEADLKKNLDILKKAIASAEAS